MISFPHLADNPPGRAQDRKNAGLSVHRAFWRRRTPFLALIANMAKRRGSHQGDGHAHSD
jgi:hypothetical protein